MITLYDVADLRSTDRENATHYGDSADNTDEGVLDGQAFEDPLSKEHV